jgi:signal transduction histidine kinase
MNVEHAPTEGTESRERHSSARLHGRWIVLARAVCLALVALTLLISIASILSLFATLHILCTGTATACNATEQLAPSDVRRLQELGLSIDFYAIYTIVIMLIFALGYWLVAALLFWRKSDNPLALLAAVTLGTFPIAFNSDFISLLPSPWSLLGHCISFLGDLCIVLFFYVFPSGHFVPHWTRWVLIPAIAYWGFNEFFPQAPFNPFFRFPVLNIVTFLVVVSGMVIVQVYRYRRVSTPAQRQQTKWVVFGVSMGLTGFLLLIPLFVFFPALFQIGTLGSLIEGPAVYGLMLLLPLSIGIAILRYRLWDIDILINRTLVYGALTASAAGIYALVVGGLGALLQARGNLGLSLLATGLIAVLIKPLHTRLQRAVNHLLYGERDEPYKVISRLGQRLEATLAPQAVLPTIVETVTQALRLPYAAISLKQDGEDVIAASSGRATDELTRLPLVYQSEHIGDLLLAPRARGEAFSSADRILLADLARQAGIAVHAVRLTTDLQRLTKELQHSRTELVTAREEERRRLRRDLHDGLGSVLASLNWRAGTLRMVLVRDPVAADALVVEQQNTIQAAIGDIRRLVYDLRPPALDELGLIGAIRERAAQQSAPTERDSVLGLRIDVVAPDHLPALPAAVEVAAYRIVQEALANVVRHAQAHKCCICLSCENDLLHVEVTDDGIGLPESFRAGVGLLSLRERAAELGGTCKIAQLPEGGTCVQACLPLLKYD